MLFRSKNGAQGHCNSQTCRVLNDTSLSHSLSPHANKPCPPARSGKAVTNGEDSSSSEEEKEREGGHPENGLGQGEGGKAAPPDSQVNGATRPAARSGEEEGEEEEGSSLPTIYFSHTVEPKKVSLTPPLTVCNHLTEGFHKRLSFQQIGRASCRERVSSPV